MAILAHPLVILGVKERLEHGQQFEYRTATLKAGYICHARGADCSTDYHICIIDSFLLCLAVADGIRISLHPDRLSGQSISKGHHHGAYAHYLLLQLALLDLLVSLNIPNSNIRNSHPLTHERRLRANELCHASVTISRAEINHVVTKSGNSILVAEAFHRVAIKEYIAQILQINLDIHHDNSIGRFVSEPCKCSTKSLLGKVSRC